MTDDLIPIGVITGTHGVRGALRLRTYSGEATSLVVGVGLRLPDGRKLKLLSFSPVKGAFVTRFEGIDSCNAAEALAGAVLSISKSDLPPPDEGEFYVRDLLGCELFREDGSRAGVVKEFIDTGATGVIAVDIDGKEVLLPMVAGVIKQIDTVNKKILVDDKNFL